MRKNATLLRNIIVLSIIFLIIYELVDSFRNGNYLGITMSVMGMVAFVVTVRLARKLARSNAAVAEEEVKEIAE